MSIHVTAGDCLNRILSAKYPEETFIPFREAMIDGPCSFAPFSDEFLAERASFHGCTLGEYKKHMAPFLDLLGRMSNYSEIVLWFGDEPFCRNNSETVIAALKLRGYQGSITLNIVIEETGQVLRSERIQ